MTTPTRRSFLRTLASGAGATAALASFPPAIRNALAIAAHNRTGTIEDVEHIVLMMMENRSFDHYFGAMPGVRGFADRFPIPVPNSHGIDGKTVWYQFNSKGTGSAGSPSILAPQYSDTTQNFALLRTAGTPHLYPDAQDAWDHGRMNRWPTFKNNASMVYFKEADLPFQYALANAFTVCDANHSSFSGGTNPNRCFFYTGTNEGRDDANQPGVFNGPAMDNGYNQLRNGTVSTGYTWMTYAERLEDAGVSWQVYQNQEREFYALNSLLGFKSFREANAASVPNVSPLRTPRQQALYEKGIKTRDIDLLKADVLANRLPQVSWICATSSGSEHPSASSPAQGAAYTSLVLDALTANPEVWSKTVLIINFDENDGLFDHMPPPAPPSYTNWDSDPSKAQRAGDSTVSTVGEYLGEDNGGVAAVNAYKHRPYGMGPRVPMYVISPWSKGGWVNSQVFDQTSTIRFVEKRFGVLEPNISAWRRSVAGDLSSCFNFATPNDADFISTLPETATRDAASRALGRTTTPPAAPLPVLPAQAKGVRPSRALPYALHVDCVVQPDANTLSATRVKLHFGNTGTQGAVFHVYDRLNLGAIPRRYTVEPGKWLAGEWTPSASGAYDLWVLGPNGFHRHFTGNARRVAAAAQPNPEIAVRFDAATSEMVVDLTNTGTRDCSFSVVTNAYSSAAPVAASVAVKGRARVTRNLAASMGWYDFSVTVAGQPDYSRRFAGRLETGAPSVSDPAMHGTAVGEQLRIGA
jgi:phospholipase C